METARVVPLRHTLALCRSMRQISVMLPHRPFSRIAIGGFFLAVLAALALLIAGPGYRLGLWDFRPAFTLMRWAAYGGLAAVALSLLGAWVTRPGKSQRGFGLALAGVLCGFVTAAIPWQWWRTAQRVPPIHDITTDTDSPPVFVALLPLRQGAPNTADYGGPEVAAQQRRGYPDLGPLLLPDPPPQAFARALTAARDMGWNIVAAEPAEGRIEATDTTFWFGFIDDIVVRVRPAQNGSRIDVRSVSRVGRSDVGTNAARITAYLARIAKTRPGS
ncbi:MAG: DUF1499 domain-containing protein [Candidatus Binatia bacterium]|nr:DUF1499 domain-containing protein [Candidatus Binatia bacterium]